MSTPRFHKRKLPTQKRSEELVQAILEAAIRICKTKGKSFTTAEISVAAGVSVGSLYQYFPNKDSILFALHKLEWQTTREKVAIELLKPNVTFTERVTSAIHAFLESEVQEIPLRNALKESDNLFKQTADFKELKDRSIREFAYLLRTECRSLKLSEARALAELLIYQTTSFASFLNEKPRSAREAAFLNSRFHKTLIDLITTSG